MAQFMMLIYVPSAGRPAPEDGGASSEQWFGYTQELQDAGVHVAGEGLEPIDTATTVRVRDGETVITDGPFADTKEMLGGFYVVDVPDRDEALRWAEKMPSIAYGSTEVRPVMVFDNEPANA
jgi:hypothetical protein